MVTTIKTIPDHIKEHTAKSIYNGHLVGSNQLCACYYCVRYFEGRTLKNTVDGGATAVCNVCSVDSVIPTTQLPNGAIYPDQKLLEEINIFMFST